MNRLCGQLNAFKVSSDSGACTKGLWIYNKAIPVKLEDGSTVNVLLVDTEGLDSVDKSGNKLD